MGDIKIIKATFFGECWVMDENDKIIATGLEFDVARQKAKDCLGTVWQVFIDEYGYGGLVNRPYDCSEEMGK